MIVTECKRSVNHRKCLLVAFDFKDAYYDAVSEEIFKEAIGMMAKNLNCFPLLDGNNNITGFRLI